MYLYRDRDNVQMWVVICELPNQVVAPSESAGSGGTVEHSRMMFVSVGDTFRREQLTYWRETNLKRGLNADGNGRRDAPFALFAYSYRFTFQKNFNTV